LADIHTKPSCNALNHSRQAMGLMSHLLQDQEVASRENLLTLDDGIVNAAIAYNWGFSHGRIDVATVARHAQVSRRTLDRRFRAVTGHSVLEEIQACRLSRAAKLLRNTRLPLKHIVHRAGFRSEEHCRVSFLRAFNMPPLSYRKG